MSLPIFSASQIDKLVAETLPVDAKPGEKVVVVTVDEQGAKVMASFKLNAHWDLQAVAAHEWSGDDSAAARVILRW